MSLRPNLVMVLENHRAITARLHEEMTHLNRHDIAAAFQQHGYAGMLAQSCKFVCVNERQQFMYDCVWIDTETADINQMSQTTRCFVWLHEGQLIADI